MDLSYSNDVAKQIDESRYQQQFYVNTRGFANHNINPYARPNITNQPAQYRNHHIEESNRVDEVILSTSCCNVPGQTIIIGRKSEDVPIENANQFWKEIQSIPHKNRRTGTTTRIGFDMTEN